MIQAYVMFQVENFLTLFHENDEVQMDQSVRSPSITAFTSSPEKGGASALKILFSHELFQYVDTKALFYVKTIFLELFLVALQVKSPEEGGGTTIYILSFHLEHLREYKVAADIFIELCF